jgi:hypothetical protein
MSAPIFLPTTHYKNKLQLVKQTGLSGGGIRQIWFKDKVTIARVGQIADERHRYSLFLAQQCCKSRPHSRGQIIDYCRTGYTSITL